MADKKRKGGVRGLDALLQNLEEKTPPTQPEETQTKTRAQPKVKNASAKKRPRRATSSKNNEKKKKEDVRKQAWIKEDHLDRLEDLKRRERSRLQGEGKRASRQALIDEALELYLSQMEA